MGCDFLSKLIELIGVSKIYNRGENEVRAINNVSLEINKGDFIAIVGSSGSGKSTMMNILGCLDVPDEGKYLLDEKDVSTLDENELSSIRNKKIGFIFQGFNLITSLTALENVELPLIYRGKGKKEREEMALSMLKRVGLENRLSHKPSEMSGGQQQRVAIARALATAPPIILADEPTGNLDSKSGEEVIKILKELHKEGKTIILITHDDDIANIAERVVRFSDGIIIENYFNKEKIIV
ncbi:MAG: ABC transporter ATP-binding protein [Oscillospiraceae bacterium]|nr:ABC transporter ATP-binding protein [Oscillospiraceae bacterium]